MTSRTPLIAGNWKMNKTGTQAVGAAKQLKSMVNGVSGGQIMIAPTYMTLSQVAQMFKRSVITLETQNLYCKSQGAYTVEISSEMLMDADCRYVTIGHYGRWQFFGETDVTVNRKINRAQAADLISVLWAGDADTQRKSWEVFSVLEKQDSDGLKSFVFDVPSGLVVIYEPLWAIDSGKFKKMGHGIQHRDEIEYNNTVVRNEKGSIDPRLILFFLVALLFITYVVLIISNRPVPDSLNEHIDAILCYIIGYLSNLPSR